MIFHQQTPAESRRRSSALARHQHTIACLREGPRGHLYCERTGASTPIWKSPTDLKCPHRLKVIDVCGSYVRNHYDSDFSQGGNGFAFSFIPKGEIWIDGAIPRAEWPYIIQHECEEAELMRAGKSYDRAHTIAKRHEDRERHRSNPGDPR